MRSLTIMIILVSIIVILKWGEVKNKVLNDALGSDYIEYTKVEREKDEKEPVQK